MALGLPKRARVPGIALVATLAAAGGGLLLFRSHVDRSWQEAMDWADREQQRHDGQDFTRPVLWGAARRGLAMISYRDAAATIRAHRALGDKVDVELRRPDADPAERRHALAVLGQSLDALREGAHRVDARRPLDWSDGLSTRPLQLLDYRTVANLATIRAQLLLREEGAPIEAVRVMLDSAQMARDLMHAPLLIDQMIGAALLGIATGETAGPEFVAGLSGQALRELAAGLAVLDENLAVADQAVHVETVLFLRHVDRTARLDPGITSPDWPGFWNRLRFGFSDRLLVASAIPRLADVGEARRQAGLLPWPRAERLLHETTDRAKAGGHPLVEIFTPALASATRSRRQAIAQLRLLRTAVSHRLGEILILDDPLGDGPLRLVDTEDGPAYRSAGSRTGRPLQRPAPR